jgi:hypothetical protein
MADPWGNIFDLESNDIATAQLAVDGQIEHCQIARVPCTLKPGAYQQTCFGWSGGFAPIILPLFQGVCLGRSGTGYLIVGLHGHAPWPGSHEQRARMPKNHWGTRDDVARAAADIGFGRTAPPGP